MMETDNGTSWGVDLVPGSPLYNALEDILQTEEVMQERKRQEELNKALAAATGSALQGDYFDD
ncbi:MAG: hypothetical protein Q4A34_01925 [Candidatus Saccharibacteria bacterium]|nr:hypothetical protein [Candidatus Saccharibacteria bacterium]